METHIINTWRDPYDMGFSTCRPRQVTLEEGLTVLVGCNGAGKSTLLENIKEQLEEERIPVLYFDNQKDGDRTNTIGSAMSANDFSFIGASLCSSEGENITLNLSRIITDVREFLETGKTRKDREREKWRGIFDNKEIKEPEKKTDDRWILLDAIDSGYSIDNVVDLKDLLHMILEDAKNVSLNLYIVISANEYELVANEKCFDVMSGKYLTFQDYNDFRAFILKTREKKNKRLEKLKEKNQNAKTVQE